MYDQHHHLFLDLKKGEKKTKGEAKAVLTIPKQMSDSSKDSIAVRVRTRKWSTEAEPASPLIAKSACSCLLSATASRSRETPLELIPLLSFHCGLRVMWAE